MKKDLFQYRDLNIYIAFAILVAVLYHQTLRSYWLYDDPYILRQAFEHRPWEYFLIPRVWRELSIRYLTPWVTLSFDFDLSLFGVHPRFFYIHQLVSLWLAACVLYSVLRLWISRGFAFYGSLLFLVSAPFAAAAEMLQIRHYIEGLIFCLLSLRFFVQALRKESFFFSVLAALFYLLAASAKELYVPFGLIMLLFPEKNVRARIIRGIPLMVSAMAYVLWRKWMLGNFVGGPGEGDLFNVYKGLGSIVLFMKNIYGTFVMMSGVSRVSRVVDPAITACLLIFISLAGFLLLKRKTYSSIFFFLIVSVAVYSVPLSIFQPYYITHDLAAYRIAFLISAYLSAIIALSGYYLYDRAGTAVTRRSRILSRTLIVLPIVGLLTMVHLSSSLWISTQREKTIKPLAEEGRFFMSAPSNTLLVKSDPVNAGPHYYENLEFFRKIYQKDEPPSVVYNGFSYVDSNDSSALKTFRIFKYNALNGTISEISESSYSEERSALLDRIKKLPFSGHLKVDHGLVDFSLGPSHSGHYFFLWGYKRGIYCTLIDIGQERALRTRGLTRLKIYWRIGWESPEGSITLSPEWFVDFSKTQEFAWSQK